MNWTINARLRLAAALLLVLAITVPTAVWWHLLAMEADARVINTAGIVRGLTQRFVNHSLAADGGAAAELARQLDALVAGLRHGDTKLGLPAASDPLFRQRLDEVAARWTQVKALAERAADDPVARRQIFDASESHFMAAHAAVEAAQHFAERKVVSLSRWQITFLVLSLLLVIFLAFILTQGINQAVRRVILGLSSTSHHVTASSAELLERSRELAACASAQAASLEETSAAMTQITAIIRQNAENANQTKQIANHARLGAQNGSKQMEHLEVAMQAINSASEHIGAIARTVNGIALQTHMLAINASVEAAHAGEAGRCFDVVASEVGRLAQHSAKAAEETEQKIEDAVQRTVEGRQVSERVAASLGEIVERARQVDELVASIAQASREQSAGIHQITEAIHRMDEATQTNARSAEESASASEELNTRATHMKASVGELLKLVGDDHRDFALLDNLAELAVQTGDLIHECQKERGRSAGFLGSRGARFAAELQQQRADTDRAAAGLARFLAAFRAEDFGRRFEEKLAAARRELDRLEHGRQGVSQLRFTPSDSFQYYTGLISAWLEVVGSLLQYSTHAEVTLSVSAYVNFLQAKEQAGRERALLTRAFSEGRFADGQFSQFISLVTAQEIYQGVFLVFASPDIRRSFQQKMQAPCVAAVERFRSLAREHAAGSLKASTDEWFAVITDKINLLKGVEDLLSASVREATARVRF